MILKYAASGLVLGLGLADLGRAAPGSGRSDGLNGRPASSVIPCRCSHPAERAPASNVYTNIPEHRLTLGQKINPAFWAGNLDDPVPPDSYLPGKSGRMRNWYWRNSCHNFTFYVVGIADKQFTRIGRYPAAVFKPSTGWNWAVCKYRWFRLPFVSYHNGRFKFYCGWREHGNFGVKMNLWAAKTKAEPRLKAKETAVRSHEPGV